MTDERKMPHSKMFVVATKPFPEGVVAIRETPDEAADEAQRLNDAIDDREFHVYAALVHFERKPF